MTADDNNRTPTAGITPSHASTPRTTLQFSSEGIFEKISGGKKPACSKSACGFPLCLGRIKAQCLSDKTPHGLASGRVPLPPALPPCMLSDPGPTEALAGPSALDILIFRLISILGSLLMGCLPQGCSSVWPLPQAQARITLLSPQKQPSIQEGNKDTGDGSC